MKRREDRKRSCTQTNERFSKGRKEVRLDAEGRHGDQTWVRLNIAEAVADSARSASAADSVGVAQLGQHQEDRHGSGTVGRRGQDSGPLEGHPTDEEAPILGKQGHVEEDRAEPAQRIWPEGRLERGWNASGKLSVGPHSGTPIATSTKSNHTQRAA